MRRVCASLLLALLAPLLVAAAGGDALQQLQQLAASQPSLERLALLEVRSPPAPVAPALARPAPAAAPLAALPAATLPESVRGDGSLRALTELSQSLAVKKRAVETQRATIGDEEAKLQRLRRLISQNKAILARNERALSTASGRYLGAVQAYTAQVNAAVARSLAETQSEAQRQVAGMMMDTAASESPAAHAGSMLQTHAESGVSAAAAHELEARLAAEHAAQYQRLLHARMLAIAQAGASERRDKLPTTHQRDFEAFTAKLRAKVEEETGRAEQMRAAWQPAAPAPAAAAEPAAVPAPSALARHADRVAALKAEMAGEPVTMFLELDAETEADDLDLGDLELDDDEDRLRRMNPDGSIAGARVPANSGMKAPTIEEGVVGVPTPDVRPPALKLTRQQRLAKLQPCSALSNFVHELRVNATRDGLLPPRVVRRAARRAARMAAARRAARRHARRHGALLEVEGGSESEVESEAELEDALDAAAQLEAELEHAAERLSDEAVDLEQEAGADAQQLMLAELHEQLNGEMDADLAVFLEQSPQPDMPPDENEPPPPSQPPTPPTPTVPDQPPTPPTPTVPDQPPTQPDQPPQQPDQPPQQPDQPPQQPDQPPQQPDQPPQQPDQPPQQPDQPPQQPDQPPQQPDQPPQQPDQPPQQPDQPPQQPDQPPTPQPQPPTPPTPTPKPPRAQRPDHPWMPRPGAKLVKPTLVEDGVVSALAPSLPERNTTLSQLPPCSPLANLVHELRVNATRDGLLPPKRHRLAKLRKRMHKRT